ncbi:hypothetical protein LY78DRAFT_659164 [Colletotrichum sublineola]|nr:hypothetical protein LY78DRAFT_659164 [Colletotrichum sublineola]
MPPPPGKRSRLASVRWASLSLSLPLGCASAYGNKLYRQVSMPACNRARRLPPLDALPGRPYHSPSSSLPNVPNPGAVQVRDRSQDGKEGNATMSPLSSFLGDCALQNLQSDCSG